MPRDDTQVASLLEDAIDIPIWLHEDRATSFSVRSERDRSIGRELGSLDPVAQVRHWWERAGGERPGLGRQICRARTLVTLSLGALGPLLGAGLALGALRYDGQHPVNVVTALAVLVALPLGLLLGSLLLLPERVPGLRGIQRALAAVNVGALASALVARLAPSLSERLAPLAYSASRRGPAARVGKWQVVLWSQVTGLGFSLGAVVTSFVLVVFTDLAFGWSTTLDLGASRAKAMVDVIAAPWADWLPQAVPDAALIEDSRFYRLERSPGALVPAERLTGWWPFLLAALVTYGIVPRLAVLLLARARLQAATRELLLSEPEVRALIDRMQHPSVALAGIDGAEAPAAEGLAPMSPGPAPAGARRWHALFWNGSLPGEARARWIPAHLGAVTGSADVGGGSSLEQDLGIVARLEADPGAGVAVITKAWEPPLGDFLDFLEHLRAHLGPQASIMVVPVGLEARPAGPEELAMWRRAIARLADPAVYVEGLGT